MINNEELKNYFKIYSVKGRVEIFKAIKEYEKTSIINTALEALLIGADRFVKEIPELNKMDLIIQLFWNFLAECYIEQIQLSKDFYDEMRDISIAYARYYADIIDMQPTHESAESYFDEFLEKYNDGEL